MNARVFAIGGLLWAPFSCSSKGEADRAEVASVTVVIDRLREAPNSAKDHWLTVLRKTTCTLPDVCGLREQCANAYASQVEALTEIAKLRDNDASPPGAASRVAAIEQKLATARDLAKHCVDSEAKLLDRYRVKSTKK